MPKVVKVGNSLGITLSKADLDAVQLKQGDEVEIRPRGSILEIRPLERRLRLRPELQRIVDETMEEFDPALKRLAE